MSIKPTAEQQKAIDCERQNAVIIANPGSGKTFTISRMIARESLKLRSYQGVIAISYTNKASEELRGRCEKLGVARKRSFFGTIDSFCLGELVMPFAPQIINKPLKLSLLEDKDSSKWKSLKKLPIMSAEHINQKLTDFILQSFQSGKLPIGALGPAALVVLEKVPQAKIFIKARYTSVFIDEYQDCGLYQNMLMEKLVSLGLRGIAVGDIHQAIFRFANKSPEYLIKLSNSKKFEEFKLTKNYRCNQSIEKYSLALLGKKVNPIATKDRRVFAVKINGDESALAGKLESKLPSIMKKYGVKHSNDVAIIGATNKTLDRICNSLNRPYKRFINTPLDTGLSKWRHIFSDLLTEYYKPTHFAGDFLDEHLGIYAKPAIRHQGMVLLDEYFSTPEDQLSSQVGLAIKIANLCEPGMKKEEDIDAYKKVVSDDSLRRNGFQTTQEDEINVLTYHRAKGLEYDIVFCLETYKYIMPPYKSTKQLYQQSLCTHYVGITRAKKACYILLGTERHKSNGELKKAEHSPFLYLNGLMYLRRNVKW